MVLVTFAALIWLQPATGIGPDVSTEYIFCLEPSDSTVEKPYFDFIILPIMFISGGLMIADRKLPKNKTGLPMRISGLQMLCIFAATILSWVNAAEFGMVRTILHRYSLFNFGTVANLLHCYRT